MRPRANKAAKMLRQQGCNNAAVADTILTSGHAAGYDCSGEAAQGTIEAATPLEVRGACGDDGGWLDYEMMIFSTALALSRVCVGAV